MGKILDHLQAVVEAEGLEEGTPAYEHRLLVLRVEKCIELQAVPECGECKAFEHCEYARQLAILKKYRGR